MQLTDHRMAIPSQVVVIDHAVGRGRAAALFLNRRRTGG